MDRAGKSNKLQPEPAQICLGKSRLFIGWQKNYY